MVSRKRLKPDTIKNTQGGVGRKWTSRDELVRSGAKKRRNSAIFWIYSTGAGCPRTRAMVPGTESNRSIIALIYLKFLL